MTNKFIFDRFRLIWIRFQILLLFLWLAAPIKLDADDFIKNAEPQAVFTNDHFGLESSAKESEQFFHKKFFLTDAMCGTNARYPDPGYTQRGRRQGRTRRSNMCEPIEYEVFSNVNIACQKPISAIGQTCQFYCDPEMVRFGPDMTHCERNPKMNPNGAQRKSISARTPRRNTAASRRRSTSNSNGSSSSSNLRRMGRSQANVVHPTWQHKDQPYCVPKQTNDEKATSIFPDLKGYSPPNVRGTVKSDFRYKKRGRKKTVCSVSTGIADGLLSPQCFNARKGDKCLIYCNTNSDSQPNPPDRSHLKAVVCVKTGSFHNEVTCTHSASSIGFNTGNGGGRLNLGSRPGFSNPNGLPNSNVLSNQNQFSNPNALSNQNAFGSNARNRPPGTIGAFNNQPNSMINNNGGGFRSGQRDNSDFRKQRKSDRFKNRN